MHFFFFKHFFSSFFFFLPLSNKNTDVGGPYPAIFAVPYRREQARALTALED
jgi:hypothetical protein